MSVRKCGIEILNYNIYSFAHASSLKKAIKE